MRKVIYAMSVSLDGFMEAVGGDIRWGDPRPDLMRHMNEREQAFDTHLYGRRLYENMTAYWPTADQDPAADALVLEYARLWKQRKIIVFSRTLTEVSGNCELFRGDLAAGIRALKAQPGKDMVVGGAGLAASFMQLGLIDEFWLYIRPILLGNGKRMFPQLEDRIDLQLVETRTFDAGVILLRLVKKAEASGT